MLKSKFWLTLKIVFLAAIFAFNIKIIIADASEAKAKPAHHTKHGFKNRHGSTDKNFTSFLKWRWNAFFKESPLKNFKGVETITPSKEALTASSAQKKVTWLGHSTLLIQFSGVSVLTDPHFTKRASPVSFAGPKRYVQSVVKSKDIPAIDYVVISHNHYDHLDKQTVKNISVNHPKAIFLVPLGLKKWFADIGIKKNVFEMDWWQEHKHTLADGSSFDLILTPVQHWSARGVFDRNETLWGGWVFKSSKASVFFAGDTGYSKDFKEIGEKYGPFQLSLVPIGAYEPRWFMKEQHVDPAEAVQIHLDLRSKKSIGIHWGTFVLTDEFVEEPVKKLKEAIQDKGLSKKSFVVLKHGETSLF